MDFWDWLSNSIDSENEHEHRRFWLVMLIACGVAALFDWLLPAGGLHTFLVAAAIVTGLVTGIIWERAG